MPAAWTFSPTCPNRDGVRLTFEVLADRAQPLHVAGVDIRAASLTDIIASKEWTNRPKDRQALGELYAIRDADPDR